MADFSDKRVPQRIWNKLEINSVTGCWLWQGYVCPWGYARTSRMDGITNLVHRYMSIVFNGPVTEGFDCSHTCGVSRCCNPDHIVRESRKDNLARKKEHRALGLAPTYDYEYVSEVSARYYKRRKAKALKAKRRSK